MILLIDREDAVIDSYRPQTDNTSQKVTQGNTPDESLQSTYAASRQELPSPTVGGATASGTLNGYSNGIAPLTSRTQPFSGAVATPPPILNSKQGEVGMNNRQSKLYAGVMNQLVQYSPSQQSYAAAWVGATVPAKDAK